MTEALVVRCVELREQVPASGRFCSQCGSRLASDDLPTFSSPARPASPSPLRGPRRPRPRPEADTLHPTRAASSPAPCWPAATGSSRCWGAAGWARSIAPTTSSSDQPVALKFLPEAARRPGAARALPPAKCRSPARSRTRTSAACTTSARRTGSHFLSMEYVDGEDLASLLRRIGRLPADKASRSPASSAPAWRPRTTRASCTATSSPPT